MTVEITVRLADELVTFIDSQAGSRASVVERALRREIWRARATRDAEILAAWLSQPDDLDQLVGAAPAFVTVAPITKSSGLDGDARPGERLGSGRRGELWRHHGRAGGCA